MGIIILQRSQHNRSFLPTVFCLFHKAHIFIGVLASLLMGYLEREVGLNNIGKNPKTPPDLPLALPHTVSLALEKSFPSVILTDKMTCISGFAPHSSEPPGA